jgi:hypothetical protein
MTVCNARLADRETVFRSATALQNTMNFSFEVSKNCLKEVKVRRIGSFVDLKPSRLLAAFGRCGACSRSGR